MADIEYKASDNDLDKISSSRIKILLRDLGAYRRLLAALFCLFVALFAAMYAFVRPTYEASAVIGQPNPSPTASLLAGISGGSGLGGTARRLLGGGGSSGNDPFQETLQLLYSARLADDLVYKDKLLPLVFFKQWDARNNRWVEPGSLHRIIAAVKNFMHRPVSDYPDSTMLSDYLEKNLDVSPAKSYAASFLSSSGYMTVTLKLQNRENAQKILMLILHRADEIIRQDQLRDVKSRINHLNEELLTTTQSDQRTALIETLSSQMELETMVVADQRYASIMVDTPYASPVPVSPMKPTKAVIFILLGSLFVWTCLVLLANRFRLVARTIRIFRSRR